ncbi:MAG: hypothetical protein JO328_00715 [Hyphomicrobiales bacterium]|nr:hypothetical protein [Hyphomicrobiales bacterium]MBV8826380.1 hypothetical protein [Hyphomicrobiales bacterium]MBV9428664.1 hypothetical protein [Bradyrhizobiaceae bacterium]
MPIEFPQPPEQARALAEGGVSAAIDSAREHRISPRLTTAAADRSPALSRPHATYNLTPHDIAERRPLAAARLTAWRFLIASAGEPLAAGEVDLDGAGHPISFASLNIGPFVGSTLSALETAEKMPEVANGRYEARLLRIPEMYVMALWLKPRNAGDGIVVPLNPAPPALLARHAYDEAGFLAALAAPARECIAMAERLKHE